MCAARSTRHPAVVDLGGAGSTRTPTPSTPPKQSMPKAPKRSQPSRSGPSGSGGRPGLRRWWLPALGAVAAVVVAGVIGIDTVTDDSTGATSSVAESTSAQDDSGLPVLNLPAAGAPTPTPESPAPSPVREDCAAERGDQDSADGVVRAFQYAYYVRRDGAAVRALAAPSTTVADGPAMQSSIDALPPGTSYCLTLTEIGPSLFATRLTELRPAAPPQLYAQTVSTTQIDGRWFVEAFQ